MFNKDYFVISSTDKVDFDTYFSNYKNFISNAIKNNVYTSYESYLTDSDEASKFLDPIVNKYSLLSSIKKTDGVSEMYEYMMEQFQDFFGPLMQSVEYYEFIKSLETHDDYDVLSKEKMIKGFEKNGLNLSIEAQKQLNDNNKESMKLSIAFSNNIVNSKKEWKYILDQNLLNLSEQDLSYFTKENDQYVLYYKDNDFYKIMEESENIELKKVIFNALNYPASPNSSFDNTPLLRQILSLRQKNSELFGKDNFSSLVLEDRMAKNPETVEKFLHKIHNHVYDLGVKENKELIDFSKKTLGMSVIEPYNRTMVSTKFKEHKFNYKNDSERDYFQIQRVFDGCFDLATKIFGFEFKLANNVFELPYSDTVCYEVFDNNKSKGYLLIDLYERENKGPGAWVSGLQAATWTDQALVSLVCNFNKKEDGLNIGEIHTFLHEMGHALHHFSSVVKYSGQAGTNGVARDAVEIPSQMLEQFAYNKDFLLELSSHKDTQEKITEDLVDNLIAMKNYMIGMHYIRQIGFGLFDISLHTQDVVDVVAHYKNMINKLSPVPVREDSYFPNTFGHIFAGGYASGYYGYLWADIYSIDAYLFIKEDLTRAKKFKNEFLAHGSSKEPAELYQNFRESEVDMESFLNYYDI